MRRAVRLWAKNLSGLCDTELYSDGPGKPYELRKLPRKQSVLLEPSRIPERRRARYKEVFPRC